ncbi:MULTISPECIES: winged helix-turn-helix transcriptional regulator [Dietzia]|uniref:Winged helix-turn-helix transcriptional regulator n=1 Tax=Dietzia cercidiphylli TaxID=498199 RepID=A0ABN2J5C4_9ACTN|nr:helix-turn-helix domain-containing protein [Dietzia cercidiphylli]
MGRTYGQFCGLARAAEVLGERWTLLVLRDLSVGPARFTDLRAGLPGIAATMLTSRLRDLEEAGVVVRSRQGKSVTYDLTDLGRAAMPALRAMSLWGASTMATPRVGEIVTDRSLAAMMMTTRTDAPLDPFVVEVRAGEAIAHAEVTTFGVETGVGPARVPDCVFSGPGLRAALADPSSLSDLVAEGLVEFSGERVFLERFAAAFCAPLTSPMLH